MQIERLPAPTICYWPMFMGPWGDPERPAYVVVWLYFYITIWFHRLPARVQTPGGTDGLPVVR